MGRLVQRKGILRRKLNLGLQETIKAQSRAKQMEKVLQRKLKWEKIQKSKLGIIFETYYDGEIKPAKSRDKYFWENKSFDLSIKKLHMALNGELFDDSTEVPDEFCKLVGEQFTIDDIISAISSHKKALSKQYYPTNKKILHIHLDSFILNEFAKTPMSFSFLSYWTLFDPKTIIERIISPNSYLLDRLLTKYKEEIPIIKQNRIIKNIDLVVEDISRIKIIYPIQLDKALDNYFNEVGIYPSDMADFNFRKNFCKYYREKYGI